MRKARERQRAIVALIGTIMLVTSLALAAGSIRPTEAQWEDKAYGESVFGTADNAGLNYARALATYGTFARPISPLERIGPAHQLDTNTTNPTAAPFQESTMRFQDVGFLGLINMSVTGATCARSDQASLAPCPSNTPPIPAGAASFASGSANGLRISTGLLPLARYTDTLRTTASCTPGRVGTVAVERNGDLVLGAWPGTTSVPIPVAGEGQRIARSTASHRETGLYTYTATVTHVKETGVGYAKSDMYLELHSDTTLGDSERWSLIIGLASAECGLSRDPGNAPGYPTANAGVPQVLARNSLVTTEAMSPFVNAVELQNLDEVATPDTREAVVGLGVGEGETEAPSLDDAANDESVRETDEDSEAATTTSATPSPTASAPAETTTAATSTSAKETATEASTTVPGTSEPASSESAVPTEDAVAEPTEQTAVAEGPQEPETVRVGREFAVLNREGVELGTAKVENIVRTPGCGVELTLSITTSAEAGPDRWASVAPDDFAEVRPGGSTREATTLSSDCEQAARSTTTPLSPGRDYEIVIAFRLDDSAEQAMLRPEGTAGWIFELPAQTTVTVTISPSAAPSTEQAPGISTDTGTGTELTSAVETTEA